MEDINVLGSIKIDAKGKTKEQIREEVLQEVTKKIDAAFGDIKVEEEKREPKHIHILADEHIERNGFGVEVDWNGDFADVMTMFTVAVSETLHRLAGDEEDEYSPEMLLDFIDALIAQYKRNALTNTDEEEE